MQIYSVSLYAARAALATIATSTSSDTSELLTALVRARARKSLRLVFARPLGCHLRSLLPCSFLISFHLQSTRKGLVSGRVSAASGPRVACGGR